MVSLLFVSRILEILSQEQRVQNSIAVNTGGEEGWGPHEAKMFGTGLGPKRMMVGGRGGGACKGREDG